jgi:hypothetical protein
MTPQDLQHIDDLGYRFSEVSRVMEVMDQVENYKENKD